MFKRAFCYVTLVCFLAFVCGCSTYQKHPNFKERHKTIQSVAAMPPEVEIYKLTFKGDKELMPDVMEIAAKNMIAAIEESFSKKGYIIEKLDLSEEVLSAEPQLRTALFNIRKLFNSALEDIQKRRKPKFTYNIGPDVNEFANLANCDVLIFARCDGFKKSGGEIAKDLAKSILIAAATLGSVMVHYYMSVAVLNIAVVDGDNGDILWYITNQTAPNIDAAIKNQLVSAIRNLLKPFPKRVCYKKPAEIKEEEILKSRLPEESLQQPQPQQEVLEELPQEDVEQEEPAQEDIEEEPSQEEETEAGKPTEVSKPTEEKTETGEPGSIEGQVDTEEQAETSLPQTALESKKGQVRVEVLADPSYSTYIEGVKEKIKAYADKKEYPEKGEVWMAMDILPDGRIQNLKVIKERSTDSELLQTQGELIIYNAYPFEHFSFDMTKEPIPVKVGLIVE